MVMRRSAKPIIPVQLRASSPNHSYEALMKIIENTKVIEVLPAEIQHKKGVAINAKIRSKENFNRNRNFFNSAAFKSRLTNAESILKKLVVSYDKKYVNYRQFQDRAFVAIKFTGAKINSAPSYVKQLKNNRTEIVYSKNTDSYIFRVF